MTDSLTLEDALDCHHEEVRTATVEALFTDQHGETHSFSPPAHITLMWCRRCGKPLNIEEGKH